MVTTSILIPSRNEVYLNNTVNNILKQARSDFEIIIVLDGAPANPPLPENPRIRVIYNETAKGMRNAINTAAAAAEGKYLLKCDAHCCFAEGFDVKLMADCEEDWVVVPRRYAIDKHAWDKLDREYFDFQYISSPHDFDAQIKGFDWPEYAIRVKGQEIVDLMTSQGSCWFMHKSWFEKIGGLDEVNYGSMGAEAQEVCLKTWLSGGRYVLNRKTWYAHKKKRLSAKHRGYRKPTKEWDKSRKYAVKCWMNNEWPLQTRPIAWLVEKFKPIPIWHINSATVKSNRIIQRLYKLNSTIEEYPRMIPGFNRDSFVRLLNDLNYKVGCEVGVQTGVLSWMMFQAIPDLKMYLVDPYIDYKGCKKYRDTHVTSEQRALERMEGKNVVWLREFSETAYNKVPDESLDFVYIDGNHEYDYVMLDIILWQRKVRKGGMISGHDYSTRGKDKIRPIKRVVDDYTQFHNIVPWYVTDNTAVKHAADRHASWFWIK